MKSVKFVFLLSIAVLGNLALNAQEVEKVNLVQTPGEFEQKELTLKAGKSYIFKIENQGIDKLVGFVIAPKGKTDKQFHVANAYLYKTIDNGESATSQEVILEKGEYVYFCPLNPTPLYKLIVE